MARSRFSLGLLLRGMAMGVAEVVPGVSGGTIAFVTGIYEEFINTLAGLDLKALPLLFKRGPVETWRTLNLGFLFVLGVGMVLSILVFARLIETALDLAAPVVWAFFFGLILYSAVSIAAALPRRALLTYGVAGLLLGIATSRLVPAGAAPTDWFFFFGGAIAIGAWMLPAVSGSFLLLVLGLYEPVVSAVNQLDMVRLGLFALGCVAGMLLFSKLLRAAMQRYREVLLAALTGFMLGSLLKLWPWQLGRSLLLPVSYTEATGEPSFLLWTVPAAMAGALLLWALGRLQP
ncbi:MAG: DUF368 domain-containing protein [Pseudomonadota bacterium]